jgi:amino acid adenylation domain-containing protein
MSVIEHPLQNQKDGAKEFLQNLFYLQHNRTPDAIAVYHGDNVLTYAELDRLSTILARYILKHSPDSAITGISTTRNPGMIVGVLAILKSGKAYLPLDPTYPPDRLKQMIGDSGINFCICPQEEAALFKALGVNSISSFLPDDLRLSGSVNINQGDLAYILFTSGSTGKPKAVSMGHAPLVNLLHWQQKNSKATVGTKTLQFAPLSFDVSFQEIFSTLTTGGTLVLIDDDLRLDPQQLLRFIKDESIHRIFAPFVALQYITEAADAISLFPGSLQELIIAGEQLKITRQVVRFFQALPDCVLYNQYGPTECHVVSALKLDGDPESWPALPSIGKPIDHCSIYILDEKGRLLPENQIGELCIGGVCLAEGYLNRPRLTAEKFVQWEHPQSGPVRIYKTGDLAKYTTEGNIEFLGRRDDQVKIRGYRIEPGEIEVLLSAQNGIRQAVVMAREDMPGQLRLVAYLVSSSGEKDTTALRKRLIEHLPDYMMPAAFVWLDEFPKTSSGKVDKRALPKPDNKRPDLQALYKAPSTNTEEILSAVWLNLLPYDRIGVDDNFFELGGNSLLAVKTVAVLQLQHQLRVPVTKIYQLPTIGGIAAFLDGGSSGIFPQEGKNKSRPAGKQSISAHDDIAVIAMAGRFPGAQTINELWDLLKQGRETISFFTKEELDLSVPPSLSNDPDYVRARGIISGADRFDAAFFGINTKLADLMDPQQRIFLEIAWEALEKVGYLPSNYNGSIGVFAGSGNNSYYLNNVLSRRDLVERMGAFQVMTYNEKDYVASRVAYALDLKGPAVSVHSACSTSLLAIAEAVDSLRKGQCDLALAGGAAITVPLKSGHIYQEGAMYSRDGHTRSFDAHAQGTVFSDGAGVVLLKTKKAAERDGDKIWAIIKGVGINNDGGGKGSFTAPSAAGQAGAIRMALEDGNVDPSTLGYIEAHGTATPLGDPIEMEGLNMAFGNQERHGYCALGSIKSNMGHLTAAAGVAGFIKTVLSLHHQQLPPSIYFNKPNPEIDFEKSPFFVNDIFRKWETDSIRRAGVSSFGVGGTNVHVVLEEYKNPVKVSDSGKPFKLISWSAKTDTTRDAYAQKLADDLEKDPSVILADLSFTLQMTRADFKSRRFIIADSTQSLIQQLRAPKPLPSEAGRLEETRGEPVFVFPGQGSQYVNMGFAVYQSEKVFRDAVDDCAALLEPILKEDIREVIYPAVKGEAADQKINNTFYTQPALFVIEYAMARLWMSWGVHPTAFIGHSIGEFVAAHLAGVFSLADGLKLVAKRGKLMASLDRGSMLGVRAHHDLVKSFLPADLSLAAINSPNLCVVAGTVESVESFSKQLEEKNIHNKLLHTSHAFHSVMMDSVVDPFRKVIESVQLQAPQIPIISTVSGEWMTAAQATDPGYWAGHLRNTVRFSTAVIRALDEGFGLLLEAGPRNVASMLIRQHSRSKAPVAITSLEALEGQSEYASLMKAAGQLWLQGVDIDWSAFYAGQQRQLIDLPGYAFEKTVHWVDPVMIIAVEQKNPLVELQTNTISLESETTINQNNKMRKTFLIEKIKEMLENASGIEMGAVNPDTSFIEMGLDSLLLTQITLHVKREFGVPVTFRQLNESCGTLDLLAAYLDEKLPADQYVSGASQTLSRTAVLPVQSIAAGNAQNGAALSLITRQIQLLAQQVALLNGGAASPAPVEGTVPSVAKKEATATEISAEEMAELKKPFGATARIEKQATRLTSKQEAFLSAFTKRYNQKTLKSKNYAQQHRDYMADPRVVSGFKPLTKEIVYPLVVNRSKGSRLWDLDGNEYIDALNGFGSNLLGYQPQLITDALKAQIDQGYEIGPQHALAGPVCKLICEFTGFDRSALCNTGSEAVLGAMRIARTVTGRSLIVAFSGSYHGINDEVIVRGTKKLKSFPAAPGIMPESVQNMLILDYGTEESLNIIRQRSRELAAVLVEPVQSRSPEFQPVEFLKELRKITSESGTALIFDEVITGFRVHPGGTQAMFGIRADLGTYGKVIAGGMPIGVIAGKKEFMNALDGGTWQFGDDSTPEAGVTYFAGTFVRHPLALAAAKASLEYMKAKGPALQEGLTVKTKRMVDALNSICKQHGLPLFVAQFGSLWKIKFKEDVPYVELLFTLMREKGIHIWDGFPCFLTEAHTPEEVDQIIKKFEESVQELVAAEFLPSLKITNENKDQHQVIDKPPVPGAKLGRDLQGNPAWFISDPGRPGKYMQVN